MKRLTASIVPSPKSIPTIAPVAFARLFHMPSKKTPSIAPYVIEVIVNPATSTGPQCTSPRLPSTIPQMSVIHRERFSNSPGDRSTPARAPAPKSMMLDEASEFNDPLALDMATAKIAASTSPAIPGGISVTINVGKI